MAKPNTSKKLPCCRVAFGELAKNGSVAYGEFPAGWRVGSCGSGVRLRLKPMFNISLQAEPAFDSPAAAQPTAESDLSIFFYNLKPAGHFFLELLVIINILHEI